MKYELEVTNRFKKHFKKLQQKDKDIFREVVTRLANDENLEQKHCDHALKGDYAGYRECHLRPNLLLIYKKQKTKMTLVCLDIGSHAELF